MSQPDSQENEDSGHQDMTSILEVNIVEGAMNDLSEESDRKSESESDNEEEQFYKNIPEEQLERARKYNECFVCKKRCRDLQSFQLHLSSHIGVKRYKCPICLKSFAKEKYMKAHLSIHQNRSFTCDICSQNFASLSSIRGHMKIHSGAKPYKCSVCDKAFRESSTRGKHMLVHFPERKVLSSPCEICGKILSQQSHLSRHMKTHFRQSGDTATKNNQLERKFKCDQCEAKFKYAHSLKIHTTTHTGVKDYTCNVCSKEFNALSNLTIHMRIHSGCKSFVCEICSRAFTLNSTLKRHMATHDPTLKTFVCHICSKAYTRKGPLEMHMTIHTGEAIKNHTCQVCSKAYQYRSSLQKHMNAAHAPDGLFQCELCAKKFTGGYSLKKHLERHEKYDEIKGIEEGKCAVCSKTFETLIGLKVHLSTHYANKQHECQICSKKFTTKNNLYTHIKKVHSGKPYECQICCPKKSFATSEKLETHQAKHFTKNNDLLLPCNICYKTFRSGNLQKHLMQRHNVESYDLKIPVDSIQTPISHLSKPMPKLITQPMNLSKTNLPDTLTNSKLIPLKKRR